MASDWNGSPTKINGINLANYFPQQRSYNSIVYIHKKYLQEPTQTEDTKKKFKLKKDKRNKSQQFTSDKATEVSKDKTYKIINNDNTVLEQTIRFAKNIVPFVIPPSEDNKSNVFYTVKTSKSHRKKEKKHRESSFEHHEPTHEREEPKKIVETYRKVKKESFSVKGSASPTSNNTLDDLNINPSLCCTFSEVSEKKYHKKESNHSKKVIQGQNFAISESFEAVATENMAGDAKIKIHLMNEKDKHFLSDSIKEPVLNAIKDCISELNSNILNTEMSTVQQFIKCNSQKLDKILDKLTCIEKKLDWHEDRLDTHERKFETCEKTLDSHEKEISIHEKNIETHKNKIDIHDKHLESHEKKLDTYGKTLDSHEKKLATQEKKPVAKTEDKKKPLAKVQDSKAPAKVSPLESLGEDIFEIKEEYSSEEELHHELLDRRSKSTVVLEFDKEKEDKKLENLGGGEVPRSMKGSVSVGGKLERPNRIPARFCWTDAGKKT